MDNNGFAAEGPDIDAAFGEAGGSQMHPPLTHAQRPLEQPAITAEAVANFMQLQTRINDQQNDNRRAQDQRMDEILQFIRASGNNKTNGSHGNSSSSRTTATVYTPTDNTSGVNTDSLTVLTTSVPKQRMGKIQPYTDEDKSLYPQYKGKLQAKLLIDALALGANDEQRAWWVFGTLDGKASTRIFPWVDLASRTKALTTASLLEQMDQAFLDPEEKEKALRAVNTMQQKKKDLREYVADFEENLLKAGGWAWAEEVKKSMFLKGVNKTIKAQMVGKELPATYSKVVAFARKISDDLAALNLDNGTWRHFTNNKGNFSGNASEGNSKPRNGDSMDWEPTTSAAAARVGNNQPQNKPRAKWVPKEVITSRRDKGQCLRCGSDAHFISQCDKGPARRPESASELPKKRVRVATVKAKAPAVEAEEMEESDTTLDESENE
jgi:hypothetical protein